jgi:hypothetical protein
MDVSLGMAKFTAKDNITYGENRKTSFEQMIRTTWQVDCASVRKVHYLGDTLKCAALFGKDEPDVAENCGVVHIDIDIE